MITIVARAALLSLTASSLALASPAMADDEVEISYGALGAVLEICVGSIKRGYDFNDVAALAVYGLAPAADEADFRASTSGMEAARGHFPHGDILVAQAPGRPCMTLISGSDRFTARDAVLAELDRSGARMERENGAGYQTQTYYYTSEAIIVQTTDGGTVNIGVKHKD